MFNDPKLKTMYLHSKGYPVSKKTDTGYEIDYYPKWDWNGDDTMYKIVDDLGISATDDELKYFDSVLKDLHFYKPKYGISSIAFTVTAGLYDLIGTHLVYDFKEKAWFDIDFDDNGKLKSNSNKMIISLESD